MASKKKSSRQEDMHRNLKAILDVPMQGRVVLGTTEKKLHELMDIKPGMIIETDHPLTEYVELWINDHVIALGEIVSAGENYGFQVKKIINAMERIQKLQAGSITPKG